MAHRCRTAHRRRRRASCSRLRKGGRCWRPAPPAMAGSPGDNAPGAGSPLPSPPTLIAGKTTPSRERLPGYRPGRPVAPPCVPAHGRCRPGLVLARAKRSRLSPRSRRRRSTALLALAHSRCGHDTRRAPPRLTQGASGGLFGMTGGGGVRKRSLYRPPRRFEPLPSAPAEAVGPCARRGRTAHPSGPRLPELGPAARVRPYIDRVEKALWRGLFSEVTSVAGAFIVRLAGDLRPSPGPLYAPGNPLRVWASAEGRFSVVTRPRGAMPAAY